jgi:hypothetical protein
MGTDTRSAPASNEELEAHLPRHDDGSFILEPMRGIERARATVRLRRAMRVLAKMRAPRAPRTRRARAPKPAPARIEVANDPPEPPQRYADQHDVAALGIARSSRAAVAMIKSSGVAYARCHGRYIVALVDFLHALGFVGLGPTTPPKPPWSAERLKLQLLRGGRR